MPKLIVPEKLKNLAAKDPLAHVDTLTWHQGKTKIDRCSVGCEKRLNPQGQGGGFCRVLIVGVE
jgi:hypothetical protein